MLRYLICVLLLVQAAGHPVSWGFGNANRGMLFASRCGPVVWRMEERDKEGSMERELGGGMIREKGEEMVRPRQR